VGLAGGAAHIAGPVAATGESVPTVPPVRGQLPLAGDVAGDLPGLLTELLPRVDAPALPATPAVAPPCEAFTLTAALFADNSPALLPEAGAALHSVARQLKTRPGAVRVVGFTDARPATFPGGNQGLSEARAQAVSAALAARGVSDIVDIEGRGAQEPVDVGKTEATYGRNRRVEVALECTTSPGSG
jgi:outer membrane protein OmpA-like peptidoglycan-associated protein